MVNRIILLVSVFGYKVNWINLFYYVFAAR